MVINLSNSLINRERIIDAVKSEIIGPSIARENYKILSPESNTEFSSEESRKNYFWYHCGLLEEVLQTDYPSRRYSAGMLYPMAQKFDEVTESDALLQNNSYEESENKKSFSDTKINLDDNDDEISQSSKLTGQDFLQSSLGLTCRISTETKKVKVRLEGAKYLEHRVKVNGKLLKWWLRESVFSEKVIILGDGLNNISINEPIVLLNNKNEKIEGLNFFLNVTCRLHRGAKILTVSVVNRTESKKNARIDDALMLFQSEITLTVLDDTFFLKYPKAYERSLPLSDDELADELLYRNKNNYAFGHGCSTKWDELSPNVTEIKTTFIPTYETQSMTPDVEVLVDGKLEKLSIRMIDIVNSTDFRQLENILMPLINGYYEWIKRQENEIGTLGELKNAAKRNIELCKESLERIRRGLDHLQNEENFNAFILANKAMLLQQVNGKGERVPSVTDNFLSFDMDIKDSVKLLDDLSESVNAWRAFQIAFFLMSIDSVVNEKSLERNIVDLIWFPTGGGKTEAYLAVAAFQMFYRRIKNPEDVGVDVLMRYTLRLLTADQFQRSSRLICAMEYLRKKEPIELGCIPFSIGMWVGGTASPNKNKDAISKLNSKKKWKNSEAFLVNRCPWCGCKLGQVFTTQGRGKSIPTVLGFKNIQNRLVTHCPDSKCDFHNEIPIYFVDETIYEKRPSFMIGTVDKFVQLSWNPAARSLFGIDENGVQEVSPPNLIIQDELHLISGPLGTLYGLFECVIEELCTKKTAAGEKKPKIISATATIKEFQQQAKDLFAREDAKLFPSPGLDIDDSFFAKIAVDEKTNIPSPGRKYVGVYTSNVGLMMSEVQVFSSILQEANQLSKAECDPFWTLLAFYNSLRDLGAGINLCNMDIPTYMNAIQRREGYEKTRFISHPLELTSRMQSQEISKAIDSLKKIFNPKIKQNPIDVCLASNIIEVGVDIDRLSVMAVVGQPKSTAQYIQVTGRVGRRWDKRPGVIFTLFSNRNSRDKSHFEHFVEYHQRLYAQVETTSVTPFSDASLERGLSAVIIAFIRQRFSKILANRPDADAFREISNGDEYKKFISNIKKRMSIINPEQDKSLKSYLKRIENLIASGDFTTWRVDNNVQGLMFQIGNPIAEKNNPKSIGVINSLRSVDAESIGVISNRYFNKFDTTNELTCQSDSNDSMWGDFE